jgi:hypothetical protein
LQKKFARLDEAMEHRLLDEPFEAWVSQQVETALPPAQVSIPASIR